MSFIAANMRPLDRRELMCQRGYSDEFTLTMEVVHYWGDCGFVVCRHDLPIACIGLTELQPGVWTAWAFGTKDTGRVIPFMSRLMMQALVPIAVDRGARRVEARSIAEHHAAHRWMESLGARGPTVLEEWGKGGETFVLYHWTLSHVLSGEVPHVLRSSSQASSGVVDVGLARPAAA